MRSASECVYMYYKILNGHGGDIAIVQRGLTSTGHIMATWH